MQLPSLIAKLVFRIPQLLLGVWFMIRWTNLLALAAGRFHTSWVQGIGAALYCAIWLHVILGVYVLNGIFQIDPTGLGRLDWVDWLFLPIISILASNLGYIATGRFLVSKAKVAALLVAHNLPADSSIYKLNYRYGPTLWFLCYCVGVVALMVAFVFSGVFLGIFPPLP